MREKGIEQWNEKKRSDTKIDQSNNLFCILSPAVFGAWRGDGELKAIFNFLDFFLPFLSFSSPILGPFRFLLSHSPFSFLTFLFLLLWNGYIHFANIYCCFGVYTNADYWAALSVWVFMVAMTPHRQMGLELVGTISYSCSSIIEFIGYVCSSHWEMRMCEYKFTTPMGNDTINLYFSAVFVFMCLRLCVCRFHLNK